MKKLQLTLSLILLCLIAGCATNKASSVRGYVTGHHYDPPRRVCYAISAGVKCYELEEKYWLYIDGKPIAVEAFVYQFYQDGEYYP
jgi:hypothetical protein